MSNQDRPGVSRSSRTIFLCPDSGEEGGELVLQDDQLADLVHLGGGVIQVHRFDLDEVHFDPAEIAVAAPFMEEADVGKLALALCGKGNLKDLAAIAPFMNEKDVAAAAEELRRKGCALDELSALAPFMDSDALNKIAAEHLAGGGDIKDLIAVAPFLNGSALKEMFKNFRK
mgnify:CR=1 FL=1